MSIIKKMCVGCCSLVVAGGLCAGGYLLAESSKNNSPVTPPKQDMQAFDKSFQITTTSTSIIVEMIEGAEYSLDNQNWQESNIFAGLSPETTYTVYVRYAKTDTTIASASSSQTCTTQAEEQVAQPLLFSVSGNTVTGYTGTTMPETLTIPASYSLGEMRDVEYSCADFSSFYDYVIDMHEKHSGASSDEELFELTFTDSTGNETICKTLQQLDDYNLILMNRADLFPVTTTQQEREVIEGTDYQITDLSKPLKYPHLSGDLDEAVANVKTVNIPASITSIRNSLFSGFVNIETFNIDENNYYYKTVDGAIVRRDNGSLIAFPQGKTGDYFLNNEIKRFEPNASLFKHSHLNSLTLNSNISCIDGVFANSPINKIDCSLAPITTINFAFERASVSEIILPSTLVSIDTSSFSNCTSLTNITFPDSLTSIGSCAFGQCTNLTSINLNKVKNIEANAFFGCTKLSFVTPSLELTTIGHRAFADCTGLNSFIFQSKVNSIACDAFDGCNNLLEIIALPETPPTILHCDTFKLGNAIYTIYVPTNSVDAYKAAAGWSAYADKIVAYEV